jgi:hypothetical protein
VSSLLTDDLFVREVEARAARLAEDEFVQFTFAGTPAAGHFCCVACGRDVTCVGLLPPCPECGSRLWEDAHTSPFARGEASPAPVPAYERWLEEDLDGTARTVSGITLALVLGSTLWALLAFVVSVGYIVLR